MTKKVLIIVICLVTVCAVFGLNDNLNYQGLQRASAMVDSDSSVVVEDLQVVSAIATAIENFSPQKVVELSVEEVEVIDPETQQVIDVIYSLVYVSYYPNPVISGELDLITEHWEFSNASTAEQIRFILEPLTRSSAAPDGNDFFSSTISALHYIGFWLSLLVSVVMALLVVVCDVVGVVWSIVEAMFYLLGF